MSGRSPSATANGSALTQSPYGYWGGGPNNLAGTTLELTDVEGHVVSGTVPGFAALGMTPKPGELIVPTYLDRYADQRKRR